MFKKVVLFCVLFLALPLVYADENVNSWWFGTFTKKELSDKHSAWMETQIRNSFEKGSVNQTLYRAGLLYKPNQGKSVELGGLFGVIQSGRKLERRYTLQHTIAYTNSAISRLSHRARLELRDFARESKDSMRFRYLLRYTHKMNGLTGVLWNELFLNVTDEKSRNQKLVERNRVFVGVRKHIFNTNFEFGYLNQIIIRRGENTFEHALVGNWIF